MKKIVGITLAVILLIIIAVGVIGLGSKKADCSGIFDQKTRNRCHLYNLLNSYGLANDYEAFMKSKPYEKPTPKYFTMQFRDEAIDQDNDGKFDVLIIYAGVNVDETGDYSVESWLHDDNQIPFYKFDEMMPLQKGSNEAAIKVSSQRVYEKKLMGSLKVPYVMLFKDGKQLESVSVDYYTRPYNYNDFSVELPDLVVKKAEIKDGKLQVVVENIGKKHAFNVAVDLKVGNEFVFGQQNRNRVNLMKPGDKHEFSIYISSAKEFTVVVDPDNFVDESDETNNEMLIVK